MSAGRKAGFTEGYYRRAGGVKPRNLMAALDDSDEEPVADPFRGVGRQLFADSPRPSFNQGSPIRYDQGSPMDFEMGSPIRSPRKQSTPERGLYTQQDTYAIPGQRTPTRAGPSTTAWSPQTLKEKRQEDIVNKFRRQLEDVDVDLINVGDADVPRMMKLHARRTRVEKEVERAQEKLNKIIAIRNATAPRDRRFRDDDSDDDDDGPPPAMQARRMARGGRMTDMKRQRLNFAGESQATDQHMY